MKIYKIMLIVCLSLLFSNNSHILTKMIDSMNWDFRYTTEDGIKVFRLDNDSFPVIKIHKDIDSSMKNKIFDTIRDIENYHLIISNKNISTQNLTTESISDTLYVYQSITNMIPFVKNRHIIFKMYMSSKNRLNWELVNENSSRFDRFRTDSYKILDEGAGSWEIIDDKLYHFYYMNPKIRVPQFIINKVAENSVIDICKDILYHSEKN